MCPALLPGSPPLSPPPPPMRLGRASLELFQPLIFQEILHHFLKDQPSKVLGRTMSLYGSLVGTHQNTTRVHSLVPRSHDVDRVQGLGVHVASKASGHIQVVVQCLQPNSRSSQMLAFTVTSAIVDCCL